MDTHINYTIGVPCKDFVNTEFTLSLIGLVTHTMMTIPSNISITMEKGTIIAKSRCKLVEAAKQTGADGILFIDTDHIFPRETLVKLISSNKDIIGCNYMGKPPQSYGTTEGLDGKRISEARTGVEEVSRIGTGLLYVKMNVFEKMKTPYFDMAHTEEGWIGEDFYFCDKAKELGYKIYCDHDLSKEVGHLGITNYKLS